MKNRRLFYWAIALIAIWYVGTLMFYGPQQTNTTLSPSKEGEVSITAATLGMSGIVEEVVFAPNKNRMATLTRGRTGASVDVWSYPGLIAISNYWPIKAEDIAYSAKGRLVVFDGRNWQELH